MTDVEKAHPAPAVDVTPVPTPAAAPADEKKELARKESERSSFSKEEVHHPTDPEALRAKDELEAEEAVEKRHRFYQRYRPFILGAFALLILGWWISATVLEATRGRWIVQTFWAWFFILVIAFRFIPNSVITKPIAAVWMPLVQKPFFKLPYRVRLGLGCLVLVAIVIGSAFGLPLTQNSDYSDRAISVLGLILFQAGFYATSKNRSQIAWPTVIVGLFIQQAIALFVLKTEAGYSIFNWIATLAADFLGQATPAVAFFWSQEITDKHYFIINVLAAIIFFIAFVQMMYYIGVMQWVIKKFAWFFFKTMNVSGAEAVVAAASPFIGQGESACLVRPYVDIMTDSELHLTMTSGFATIAGSVLTAYISLGVPPEYLVTSAVMSIPASIAISKMRMPELDEPVTRGSVVVDRGDADKASRPANALHAFSQGASFGLMVAGAIFTNVLTILALVYVIDGLLIYIGKGFSIDRLTLQLILGYLFYPLTFLLGVPRAEILRVSQLLATKLIANEFVAYLAMQAIQKSDNPLTPRAFTIASYALCGFANLGSLGIQIGVLSALAPSRGKVIARIAPSAMICGFIATMQTAGIAGMLV